MEDYIENYHILFNIILFTSIIYFYSIFLINEP